MEAASILNLPVEIVERVVSYLEKIEICNLRLVAREISHKASSGKFKRFFQSKKLGWHSFDDLNRVSQICEGRHLARQLRVLTISSVPAQPDFSRAPVTVKSRERHLHAILVQLQQALPSNVLEKVVLNVVRSRSSSNMKRSFETTSAGLCLAAATCYEVAIAAFQGTQIRIRHLDLFSANSDYAFPLDMVGRAPATTDLPWKAVETLSLGLTQRPRPSADMGGVQDHVEKISCMLHSCSRLARLELRWFDHPRSLTILADRFLLALAMRASLPLVKECSLSNFHLASSTIVAFLNKFQLETIELVSIQIFAGSFRSVWDHLATSKAVARCIQLADISDYKPIVFKETEHASSQRSIRLDRSGPQVQWSLFFSHLECG